MKRIISWAQDRWAGITASLVAGIPIVSNLAAAFGVFAPSAAQQHALTVAVEWGAALGAVILFGRGLASLAWSALPLRVSGAGVPPQQVQAAYELERVLTELETQGGFAAPATLATLRRITSGLRGGDSHG